MKKVRKEIVLNFYKTMASPTLLYVSEIWNLTTNQMKKISLAGYALRNQKISENREELGMRIITKAEYRLKWNERTCFENGR